VDTEPTGMCDECGKPAQIHLTDIHDGVKTQRSYCVEHAPAEMRDMMPFGPHRTPAEEVAFLREQMDMLEARLTDPAQRAEFRAEIEKLITDIEAGRRRMGDAE
jgi:protein-arginine kinase activator protein McsA